MKKIAIISMFLVSACATSVNVAPKVGGTILTDEAAAEIVERAKDPESFEHCMRYDEVITLTGEEELALLEYCLGL